MSSLILGLLRILNLGAAPFGFKGAGFDSLSFFQLLGGHGFQPCRNARGTPGVL